MRTSVTIASNTGSFVTNGLARLRLAARSVEAMCCPSPVIERW